MNGGYDDGYGKCACFWGLEPGSFVKLFHAQTPFIEGFSILDVGCGEGKNAVFLAAAGATVEACDVSALAIKNARHQWTEQSGVTWKMDDVRHMKLPEAHFDAVVAYGLFHCLPSGAEIRKTIDRLQAATKYQGFHVICAFNSRRQELHAHPGFTPSLLDHAEYLAAYSSWEVVAQSDSDLTERHPHNDIEHTHSMTRILARKVLK